MNAAAHSTIYFSNMHPNSADSFYKTL